MSKPDSGKVWLYKCPNCGNMKSTFYSKNHIDYCKCTKCKEKFQINHNKEK